MSASMLRSIARRYHFRFLIGAITSFVVLVVAVGFVLEKTRAPTRAKWREISLGDTEESVLDTLGAPYRQYTQPNVPDDYFISGYGRLERPVAYRVLIYMEADLVFYVWIDGSEKVEEKFIGKS